MKIKILACVRHVSKGVLNVEVKATIIVMSCAFTLMCKVFIVQVSIACYELEINRPFIIPQVLTRDENIGRQVSEPTDKTL